MDAINAATGGPSLSQSECLLLSTTDLSATDVPVRLSAASSDSLAAIKSQLIDSWPRLVFSPRDDLRAEDVVLSELLNKRGPAAWVTADECGDGTEQLALLAQECCDCNTVLVLTTKSSFDLVLVPREACAEDGVAFAAFATRVDGVAFVSRTIASRQVALVLDLDSTLLESEHLPVAPAEWRDLQWKTVSLKQQPSGLPVNGKICQLPSEPHHAEGVHAAHWMWKGAAHYYRVRQRLGWSDFRELLIQEAAPGGKLSISVLSLGRPLYIQTAWQILDPQGQIIPLHEFPSKINSARPEGVFWVPEKTPCIATGLRDVFSQDFNMRLGPLWCADDVPEVYSDKYRDAVYPVEPYRPVANTPTQYDPDGSVLPRMGAHIMQYWEYCYGSDGKGGVVARIAAAAKRTLHQLSAKSLIAAAQATSWCSVLFESQQMLSSALSVQAFIEQQSAKDLMSLAPMVSTQQEGALAENDENTAQSSKGNPASTKASAERVLRPSSRQDTAPAAGPHLIAAAKATVQQDMSLAEPSLMADCAPSVDGASCGASVAKAAIPADEELEEGEFQGSLQQESDEELSGAQGRKRDFSAIICQEDLLGPGAPCLYM